MDVLLEDPEVSGKGALGPIAADLRQTSGYLAAIQELAVVIV